MAEARLQQRKMHYDWLDAIKALAMLLVIFGHLGFKTVLPYQAYASYIKLPLFFAATGFVFNPKKTEQILAFVISRIKRVLLPYCYLCAIICVFNLVYKHQEFKPWLHESMRNVLRGNIFMWFLPTMFMCNLMMLLAFRLFKNRDALIIATAVVSLIIGYLVLPDKRMIFNLNVALIAYPFCILGYYFKKVLLPLKKIRLQRIALITGAVYLLGPMLYNMVTGRFIYINMADNHYSVFPLDMLIALCGTIFVFASFMVMHFSKEVVWFGQNTIFYYAFHMPACTTVIWMLRRFAGFEFSEKQALLFGAVTMVTLVLMVPFCLFTNRYLPFLVGNTRKKQRRKS